MCVVHEKKEADEPVSTKFNQCMALLLSALKSHRQATKDLLTNSFKNHLSASDKVFMHHIWLKQEEHEDGNLATPEQLMVLADNKCKQEPTAEASLECASK